MSRMDATIDQLKYCAQDAARRFGKTPSRIRQICLEHNIGFKFRDKSERRLTDADMRKIGKIIDETGHDWSGS